MALKSMSIEKLVALKDQVEAMLSSKVLEQRRALESELSKLGRFQGGTGRAKSVFGRGGARGAVAPKYRNPENPAETCWPRSQAALAHRSDERRQEP